MMSQQEFFNELIRINAITKELKPKPKIDKILKANCNVLKELINRTNFLSTDASPKVRLYFLRNNLTDYLKCATCQQSIPLNKFPFVSIYCSKKCVDILKTNERKDKTMLERYGTTISFYSEEIKNKCKETMLERYGVEYPLQNKLIYEKTKETQIEKYGHVGLKCEDILIKTRQTQLEKYGTEFALQNNEIWDKGRQTKIDRYGTMAYTQTHIPQETLDNFDNKEWLVNEYVTNKKTQTKIALEQRVSPCLVANRLKKHKIPFQHFSFSQAEKELLRFVEEQTKSSCISNNKTIIAPYELDILIPAHNLAIEFNGIYWHGEKWGKIQSYHLNKTKMCASHNINLVHIFENEWHLRQEIVKSNLCALLGTTHEIQADCCSIVKISPRDAKMFFTNNHIQGNINCTVAYGLMYSNTLVAAISFKKSKGENGGEYQLLRYANVLYVNVIDGMKKMIARFIADYQPRQIMACFDKRWDGTFSCDIDKFRYVEDTTPTYYYFHRKTGLTLHYRSKFEKHTLKRKLKIFDPNLSEYENMVNNGYDRIWDCGSAVWVWES